jgi:DNA-binding FadR family transcriptional regulator
VETVVHSLEHRQSVAAAHERILAALQRRDASQAINAMRDHVRDSGRYWEQAGGELAKKPVRWAQLGAG